jgi:hypothetical protein
MKKWTIQIDYLSEQVLTNFGNLHIDQLNWKPNPSQWSIAQILEHLIVVNESYFPTLQSLKEGRYSTPFIGKINFVVSYLGNTILKSVEPNNKKKIRTFSIWEPSKSEVPSGIIDRFVLHQGKLKSIIENSSEFLNSGAVISSPVNKMIVYKLDVAFDIIVAHEQRHFQQAQEILQKMNEI